MCHNCQQPQYGNDLDCDNQCRARDLESKTTLHRDRYLIKSTSQPLRKIYVARTFDNAWMARNVICTAHGVSDDSYEILKNHHDPDLYAIVDRTIIPNSLFASEWQKAFN